MCLHSLVFELILSEIHMYLPFLLIPTIKVSIQGEWSQWVSKVPKIEVETHKVGSPDIVVPTLDTVRHETLLYTWLAEHKPLVLCGPPGSGKTMTLFNSLRALPDFEVTFTLSAYVGYGEIVIQHTCT